MSDFNQTVDLKEKMAQKSKTVTPTRQQTATPTTSNKQVAQTPPKKKAEEIDEMWSEAEVTKQTPAGRKEMQSIARAPKPSWNEGVLQKWLMVVAAIIVISLVYYTFSHKNQETKTNAIQPATTGWYAVKLMNNETYYGQIKDLTTDPVVMTNVYYNYDEINKDKTAEAKPTEPGALRLVKRGKENYGPDGTMSIVRLQLVLAEPLKADSKVLKAILEYEKK